MNAEKELNSEAARFLRVFCAIELPPQVRSAAASYIAQLRGAAPDVRASWEREEKLHLTLKFLGDIEEERVQSLSDAARSAASATDPFELAIRGTGAFPPHGQPRVLWLGIADNAGALNHLQQRLETECATQGFAREQKKFHPHLTIARLRSHEGARKLSAQHKSMEFESELFRVSEIVLMKSELTPHGSRYTTLGKAMMNVK